MNVNLLMRRMEQEIDPEITSRVVLAHFLSKDRDLWESFSGEPPSEEEILMLLKNESVRSSERLIDILKIALLKRVLNRMR